MDTHTQGKTWWLIPGYPSPKTIPETSENTGEASLFWSAGQFPELSCWALQRAGVETLTPVPSLAMTDGILGKAATMEIPIHGNGEAGQLPEDDGLEQVLLFDSSNCLIMQS